MEKKSANKRWKESGSTLSFKEWINRENIKKSPEANFVSFVNDEAYNNPKDIISSTLQQEKEYIQEISGFKTPEKADKSKIFGLNKNVLVFSSLLVVGSISFYFYQRLKQKK